MRLADRVRRELAASTRFADVRFLDEVDSTNRYVRDAAVGGAPEGLVVVADHQRSGRGRLGRRWEADPGTALLVSVLLRPAGVPAGGTYLVTAAAGLAAAEACRVAAGFDPELKWPNDLLVGGRKLAGVLAELVAGGHSGPTRPTGLEGAAVVVGVGCNVAGAPAGAISAGEAAGRPVERETLLAAFLYALEARCGRWPEVAAEYRRRCATVGRRVRAERSGAAALVGLAVGLSATGELLVRPDGSEAEVALSAADVTHLRPSGGAGW